MGHDLNKLEPNLRRRIEAALAEHDFARKGTSGGVIGSTPVGTQLEQVSPDPGQPLVQGQKQSHNENTDSTTRIPTRKQKRPKGGTLVSGVPREETGSPRLNVHFTIYAQRPCDWDGWHIKPIQDMLIEAGILSDDAWNILNGSVSARQVHSAEEERTEIEIYDTTTQSTSPKQH